jgi:hypothetical protein
VVGAERGDAPREQLDEQPLGLVRAAAQRGDPGDVVAHRQRLAVIGPQHPFGRWQQVAQAVLGVFDPALLGEHPGQVPAVAQRGPRLEPVQPPLDAHEGAEPPLGLGQLHPAAPAPTRGCARR